MQPALTVPGEERKPLRPRKRLPLSFILAGLAILGAVIYLVYANTQANAVYYMTVSELRSCTNCTTQSVRVAGVVQQGSIVRDDAKQLLNFVITQGGQSLAVVYSGVVPEGEGKEIGGDTPHSGREASPPAPPNSGWLIHIN